MNFKNSKGFTLIELLTVIVIIGVLATIATVFVIAQNQKARDSRRVADLSQVQKALELYYAQYGCYPISSKPYDTRSTIDPDNYHPCPQDEGVVPYGTTNMCDEGGGTGANKVWNWSLQVLVDAKLLPNLPVDPLNKTLPSGERYCYNYATKFGLWPCGGIQASKLAYTISFSTEKKSFPLPIYDYWGFYDYCFTGKQVVFP